MALIWDRPQPICNSPPGNWALVPALPACINLTKQKRCWASLKNYTSLSYSHAAIHSQKSKLVQPGKMAGSRSMRLHAGNTGKCNHRPDIELAEKRISHKNKIIDRCSGNIPPLTVYCIPEQVFVLLERGHCYAGCLRS